MKQSLIMKNFNPTFTFSHTTEITAKNILMNINTVKANDVLSTQVSLSTNNTK